MPYALAEASSRGHCDLPRTQLVTLVAQLLNISPHRIEKAIDQESAEETLYADIVEGIPCVFLAALYHAERSVAAQIKRLKCAPRPWADIDVDRAIPWVERILSIELAERQKDALHQALSSKLLIVTGGPGVEEATLVSRF